MRDVDGRWKEFLEAAERLAIFEGRHAEFLRFWTCLRDDEAWGEHAFQAAIVEAERGM